MAATSAQAFTAWCRFLAPTEGGLDLDPNDGGNWTSGMPGVGTLRGSKFGISAAAYPNVDIAGLTVEQADEIRKTDYWDKVAGDELPPALAFVVADGAYNSGPVPSLRWLQMAVGVTPDGEFGPLTEAAVKAHTAGMNADAYGLDPLGEVLAAYLEQRLLYDAALGTWKSNKAGWTLRLFRGALIAQGLA